MAVRLSSALLVVLGTAAACTGAAPNPAAGSAAKPAAPSIDAVTAIEANYQRYDEFIRQVNGDSIAALYTPDGEMVGTKAQGPAAIAAFLNGYKNVTVESNRHVTDALTVVDSLAVHWGRYRQKAMVSGKPVDASGRFVIEWHRMPDGRWLIRRLMTLPDPAKT
jgi:uncharacterized protein (TIGR02246 family)